MKILAIETSCDETGISVLEVKEPKGGPIFKVLANTIASQIKIHAPYGGVFPMLAKREHIKNLPILLRKALKKSKLEKSKKPVDLIVVTNGPGLEPALWTGIVFAKELGENWKVPVVPVNHMEGHILSVFGKTKGEFSIPKIDFPALSLLVSGGHTELVLVKNWQKYEVIGETVDDAAGEAFDKVARMLGLPYPGGPEISKLAAKARILLEGSLAQARRRRAEQKIQQNFTRAESEQNSGFRLPRPMLKSPNFNFSFSGLKTAVLYLIRDIGKLNDKTKMAIAKEFEDSVVEVLTYKTMRAVEKYGAKTLIVAGGVSANKQLKKTLKKKAKDQKVDIVFPGKGLSTDNALMIGIVGYLRRKIKTKTIRANGGLSL